MCVEDDDEEEEDEDIEKSEDMLISISDISDSNSQWTCFLVVAPRYGDEDFSLHQTTDFQPLLGRHCA